MGGKEAKRRRALLRAGLDAEEAAEEAAKEFVEVRTKEKEAEDAAKAKSQRKVEREKKKRQKRREAGEEGVEERKTNQAKDDAPGKKRKKEASEANAAGSKKPKGDPGLTVFVGQLPFTADAKALEEHFVKAGIEDIVSVRMLTEKGTNKARGMAFVQLSKEDSVLASLELHQSEFEGRWMNVERCSRRKQGNQDIWDENLEVDRTLSVFVAKLPYTTDAKGLREHFQEAGVEGIKAIKMLSEKGTNRKGMAFVQLSNAEGMEAALELHNSELGGRTIIVERSSKKGAKETAAGGAEEEDPEDQ